jgi:iron complex outermembrane receptor protein
MNLSYRPLTLAIASILANQTVLAESPTQLKTIEVIESTTADFGSQLISKESLIKRKAFINDTASLVHDLPGVTQLNAGGVSNLPVIHGLADERIKVEVDGMSITSACANHMNSPLSYISPAEVDKITVYSGGTVPVSVGGNSIAGTIKVDSAQPKFTQKGEKANTSGSITLGGQSNGNGVNGNANVTYRDESTQLTYSKTYAKSDNYQAASNFKAGDNKLTNTIGTSLYEIHTDKVSLAKKVGTDIYQFSVRRQYIPYQGYPSQYMDMTHNESLMLNAGYLGQFSWGSLDARVFHQKTEHEMNFIDTKYSPTNPQGMPMNTKGSDMGYVIKGTIPMNKTNTLTVGNELHKQELDDWWPASGNMMMRGMNPYTYWNINGGTRDRFATFAELETKQNDKWTTLIGLRHERVTTDTGNVVGYYGTLNGALVTDTGGLGSTYGEYMVNKANADAFNASDRSRTDDNIDFTAAAKYLADNTSDYEFGFARKTRSPNLYERYSWGRTGMDMKMIGWYGDGNGYLGNPDLKPEVANTLSITGNWHDAAKEDWLVKATPYASYVENYIDADKCGSIPAGTMPNENLCTVNTGSTIAGSGTTVGLRFANHDALLYGLDISAKKALGRYSSGSYTLLTNLNYVQGTILDTNANRSSNIYNIMPLNTKIALQHQLGKWNNAVELQFVTSKTAVDTTRNEFKTPDYKLVNLRTGYDWGQYRVDAGVTNLFDEMYFLPTGGAMLAPSAQGGGKAPFGAVPGMGRSVYMAGTLRF